MELRSWAVAMRARAAIQRSFQRNRASGQIAQAYGHSGFGLSPAGGFRRIDE